MNWLKLRKGKYCLWPSLGIFAIIAFLTNAAAQVVSTSPGNAVKIGFITPLSGSRASIGQDAQRAALLAVEALRKAKPEAAGRLELEFEDSAGDPARGMSAYKKLIAEGIRIVITQNSNVALPISQLVNNDGVLQLGISVTSDQYSRADDLTFRVNGPTRFEAEHMAHFIDQQQATLPGRTAVIAMLDEYPVRLRDNVLDELKKRGISVAYMDDFMPQEMDFRAMLAKLRMLDIKYILFLGYQTHAGYFVRQLKEMALAPAAIVGCVPVNNSEFFQTAGPAAEGTFVVSIKSALDHPGAQAFKKQYGYEVNCYSANSYDGITLIEHALSGCNYKVDLPCLKQALSGIRDFHGVSGVKSFDSIFGDMSDEYEVLVAREGRFVRRSE